MGAYVSKDGCAARYGVQIQCDVQYEDATNTTVIKVGEFGRGEWEGNSDIAGIGVGFYHLQKLVYPSNVANNTGRFSVPSLL